MKTILVIDDDDGIRIMISTVMKKEGFGILEADNGAEGLDIAKERLPDLIISDVMMSGMNGFMLREMLKDDSETAKIPFILMTGMAMNAGAWKADSHVEYITKPFIMPDLIALIKRKLS